MISIVRGHELDQDRRDGAACGSHVVHMRISSPPTNPFHASMELLPAGARGCLTRGAFDLMLCPDGQNHKVVDKSRLPVRSTGSTVRGQRPGRDSLLAAFLPTPVFNGDYRVPQTDDDNGKVSVQLSLARCARL